MAEKYNLSSVGPTQSYLNSSRAPVKYVRSEADTLMFLIFSVLLAFAILSGNTMVMVRLSSIAENSADGATSF